MASSFSSSKHRSKLDRPAFPGWLRRIDPSLHAEDRNTLFQAFRNRRLRRKGIKASFDAFLVTLITVINYVRARLVPQMLFKALPTGRVKLPNKVTQVFYPDTMMKDYALDLWMCGIKGSEVLEAAYLESRERSVYGEFLLIISSFGFLLFLYIALVFSFHWVDLLFFLTFSLLVKELLPLIYQYTVCAGKVRLYRYWIGQWGGGFSVKEGGEYLIAGILVSFVGAFPLILLVIVLDSFTNMYGLQLRNLDSFWMASFAVLFLAGIAFGLFVCRRCFTFKTADQLYTDHKEIDRLFNDMMMLRVLDDPDAVALVERNRRLTKREKPAK